MHDLEISSFQHLLSVVILPGMVKSKVKTASLSPELLLSQVLPLLQILLLQEVEVLLTNVGLNTVKHSLALLIPFERHNFFHEPWKGLLPPRQI